MTIHPAISQTQGLYWSDSLQRIKSLAYAGTLFSWIFGHFNCWNMNWNLENHSAKHFRTALHSWLPVVVLIELYYPTSIWINKTLLKHLSQCVIKWSHIFLKSFVVGHFKWIIICIFVVNSINCKVAFLLYFAIDFIPCLMF